MPLYLLTTTIQTVVYVEDVENHPLGSFAGIEAVRDHIAEGVLDESDFASVRARRLTIDELPANWAKEIPFGDEADERTCAEVLAEEAKK